MIDQHSGNLPVPSAQPKDLGSKRIDSSDAPDWDRLDEAFEELGESGIVCRHDVTICSFCGGAEIGEIEAEIEDGMDVRGYAFYDMRDTDDALAGRGLYLNYGAVEEDEEASLRVGQTIVEVIRRHGLATSWNGRLDTRIHVQLDVFPHGLTPQSACSGSSISAYPRPPLAE